MARGKKRGKRHDNNAWTDPTLELGKVMDNVKNGFQLSPNQLKVLKTAISTAQQKIATGQTNMGLKHVPDEQAQAEIDTNTVRKDMYMDFLRKNKELQEQILDRNTFVTECLKNQNLTNDHVNTLRSHIPGLLREQKYCYGLIKEDGFVCWDLMARNDAHRRRAHLLETKIRDIKELIASATRKHAHMRKSPTVKTVSVVPVVPSIPSAKTPTPEERYMSDISALDEQLKSVGASRVKKHLVFTLLDDRINAILDEDGIVRTGDGASDDGDEPTVLIGKKNKDRFAIPVEFEKHPDGSLNMVFRHWMLIDTVAKLMDPEYSPSVADVNDESSSDSVSDISSVIVPEALLINEQEQDKIRREKRRLKNKARRDGGKGRGKKRKGGGKTIIVG